MARRVVTYTVEENNRDRGKVFELTEMSARQAEAWAMRAFLALSVGGMEIDEETAKMGLAGLATVGVGALGKIPWDVAAPLLDEMFTCVKSKQDRGVRDLIDEDTEELSTRLALRKAVLALHFDFFTKSASPTSVTSPSTPPTSPGPTTPASLDLSVRSSRAG